MSTSISQGSAHWASSESLSSVKLFSTDAGSVSHKALILSKWIGSGNDISGFYKSLLWGAHPRFTWENYLQWAGDGHIISVAPTRAGKGVGCVIPNLLNYSGSMVVIDPTKARIISKPANIAECNWVSKSFVSTRFPW